MIVDILDEALAELFHERDRYESKREGLGDEFVEEMARLAEEIVKDPERFPFYRRTKHRRAMLSPARFPFMMIFVITEQGLPRIICVAAHRRKPRYWHGRA